MDSRGGAKCLSADNAQVTQSELCFQVLVRWYCCSTEHLQMLLPQIAQRRRLWVHIPPSGSSKVGSPLRASLTAAPLCRSTQAPPPSLPLLWIRGALPLRSRRSRTATPGRPTPAPCPTPGALRPPAPRPTTQVGIVVVCRIPGGG